MAGSAARLIEERDRAVTQLNRGLASTLAELGEEEWSDIAMVHDRKTTATAALYFTAGISLIQ